MSDLGSNGSDVDPLEEFDYEDQDEKLAEDVESKPDVLDELLLAEENEYDDLAEVIQASDFKLEQTSSSRICSPYLTKYEKTKVLGIRAQQLATGAKPFIKVPDYMTDVGEIALFELKEGKIPFIIRRPLPGDQYEYWKLTDLYLK